MQNCAIITPMAEVIDPQTNEIISIIEEKGDLKHAIRCTEQAEKRADSPWLKQACAYRLKMLRIQLARQKENS